MKKIIGEVNCNKQRGRWIHMNKIKTDNKDSHTLLLPEKEEEVHKTNEIFNYLHNR